MQNVCYNQIMNEREKIKQATYNMDETMEIASDLILKLKSGDIKGSGTKRFGIQGDIESVMGWHFDKGPVTPLSESQREKILALMKQAAEDSKNDELTDLISWLDERVEDVSLGEADRIIADISIISEEKRGAAAKIIAEIQELISEYKSLGTEDSHSLGSTQYTEEEELRSEVIEKDIKEKKIELFGLLDD